MKILFKVKSLRIVSNNMHYADQTGKQNGIQVSSEILLVTYFFIPE